MEYKEIELDGDDIVDQINYDLDSQPEDNQEDEFIASIKTPEDLMPSYITFDNWYTEWCNDYLNEHLMELKKEYHESYFLPYREELKEWWKKRYKGHAIEIAGIGYSENEAEELSNKIAEIIDNSIELNNILNEQK